MADKAFILDKIFKDLLESQCIPRIRISRYQLAICDYFRAFIIILCSRLYVRFVVLKQTVTVIK
jgi:hypothetical protein